MKCPSCKSKDVYIKDITELSTCYIFDYLCTACSCIFEAQLNKRTITIKKEGNNGN